MVLAGPAEGLSACGGARCRGLEFASKLVYVTERGPDFTRECLDVEGDGVFEVEYFEQRTDAGWLERDDVTIPQDGGVPRRTRAFRLRLGHERIVSARWLDGGWVTVSDTEGSRRLDVLPIKR